MFSPQNDGGADLAQFYHVVAQKWPFTETGDSQEDEDRSTHCPQAAQEAAADMGRTAGQGARGTHLDPPALC